MKPFATFKRPFATCGEWRTGWTTLLYRIDLTTSTCFVSRNVLNVDEPAQLITVETSLRMTWRDPRLTVRVPKSSPTNYVFFRQDVTDHIWFPDVYIDGIQVRTFRNSEDSKVEHWGSGVGSWELWDWALSMETGNRGIRQTDLKKILCFRQ